VTQYAGSREGSEAAVVQKLAFPVFLALGTILGKYDKFKNAPDPGMET